jgi:hypothetical protein
MERLKNYIRQIAPLILLVLFLSNSNSKYGIIPFCGFNTKKGFYNEKGEQVFKTTKAKLEDSSGIPDVVVQILKKLQIKVDIGVYLTKDTDNCSATVAQGGRRILIVDSKFLNKVNQETGTEWAAISIIAHEVGHHISGFGRYENPLEAELDADYWSGFVLQKLGASKQAAIKCMKKYGTNMNTESHPNREARIDSILEGYNDGENGEMNNSKCEGCKS